MSILQETIHQMGKQARAAAYKLAQLSSDEKNAILRAMAAAIRKATPKLLAANTLDLAAGRKKALSNAMLDRLMLDEKRIEAMAAGIETHIAHGRHPKRLADIIAGKGISTRFHAAVAS